MDGCTVFRSTLPSEVSLFPAQVAPFTKFIVGITQGLSCAWRCLEVPPSSASHALSGR